MMSLSISKISGRGSHSDTREAPDIDKATRKEVQKQNVVKIGTWNVCGLGRSGKIENLVLEMKRLNMEIIGMSEIQWKDQGDYWTNDHRVIYSGDEKGIAGVGFVLNRDWGQRVKSIVPLSERIILIKLVINDKEDLSIIQTYFPTSAYSDEEIEAVYDQMDEVLDLIENKDTLIILGDWNAVVGELKEDNITGNYGYGRRNRRGIRLIDFCREKELAITNTMFKQPINRRYTWSKRNIGKFQIDLS